MATDSILLLPVDILVNIFKRLNLSDLRNLMLSCKSFNDLIKNDNTIWRPIGRNKLLIDLYDRSLSNALWFIRCRTSYNWCHGYYNSKVVVNHYTNYMPWLIYNYMGRSVLLSMGSELHCYTTNRMGYPICREPLWKVDVPKIQRHDIRTNDISRFVLTNNYIACGNRDGCLIMYQKDSKDRPWLQYHVQDCHDNGQKEVTAVEAIEGRSRIMAVTGSAQSSELKFFAFFKEENTTSMYVVRGNESNIHNITMYENTGTKCLALSPTIDKLAIGLDGNSRPLVLDVNIPAFLMTADLTINPKQVLRDIRWHDANTVLYVTHAGVLQMIDTRTKEVVYDTKDPFQSSFYCVKSDGNYGIVTGTAEYSRCVLFDTRNQVHHVQMYFTQRKASPVYSLDFDPYRLITAVDRGVAVLDFNVVAASEEQKDFSHIFY